MKKLIIIIILSFFFSANKKIKKVKNVPKISPLNILENIDKNMKADQAMSISSMTIVVKDHSVLRY